MGDKREFGEGILFTVTNYIYWLFVSNILFILSNSIFIFFFMTLKPSFSNLILFFLALIPSGPAIAALTYSMEKLVRTKELSPARDFIEGYRKNLKDTFTIWLPILVIYFILLVDLQYLRQTPTSTNQILAIVIFVLTVIWTMVVLNIVSINARFKFRVRDTFKLSIYYSFMKFKQTVGNLLILFIVAYLTSITTNFFIVFTSSIIAFVMLLNTKEILTDIEQNFLRPESPNLKEQNENLTMI
ncbi:YesL family protein [Metabacillus niabensis]|uniref:Membrane protein YesL n=2 Tax=Metabacillus niabensis TaxID=324854 RepID=A0ABT9Z5A4_9BACI|nr:DUF624 domain-containing protein [Metabacillus niabensis]MDQ0227446.1 putative membrane protein YesL [Metabacillus niabensis]